MKKTIWLGFLISAVFLWSVSSCKQTADLQAPPAIFPPMPEYVPEATTFSFDAAKGDSLKMPNGTQIQIPANAFIDSTGQIVTGEIKFTYREVHDPVDIFLAGVPMEYDSLDEKGYMQTAGMFEVRAYAGDQELRLADDKQISLKMASYEAGSDYNFYTFNEDSASWQYEGYTAPEENSNIAEIKEKIRELEPKHPFPLNKDYFIFQLGTALDLYFRNDWKKIEKYGTKFMAKKLKEYGMDYIDIGAHASFRIWGRYYYASEVLWKKPGGVKLPSWINMKTAHVYEVKRVKGKTYRIGIKESDWRKKKPKKYSFTAEAYLPLQRVLRRRPNQWQEAYASIQKEIEVEQRRLETQAQVFRSYDVKQMGWCNWDRIQKRFETVQLAANFTWPGSDRETGQEKMVYYFIDNQTSYIRVRENDWPMVSLSEDKTAFFLAVIGADSIAIFDTQQYSAIDFGALKKQKEPKLDVPMKLYVTQGKEGLRRLLETFKQQPSR